MKTIIVLFLAVAMTACSSAPKQKTYTEEEAKAIYQKGVEASKPKAVSMFPLNDNEAIEKASELSFIKFESKDGKTVFTLLDDCSVKSTIAKGYSSRAFDFVKRFASALCPQSKTRIANAVAAPGEPPIAKAPPVKQPSQANSSEEK